MRCHVREPNCVIGASDHIRAMSIVEPRLLRTFFCAAVMPFTLVPLAALHFAGKYELIFGCAVVDGHGSIAVFVEPLSTALWGPL